MFAAPLVNTEKTITASVVATSLTLVIETDGLSKTGPGSQQAKKKTKKKILARKTIVSQGPDLQFVLIIFVFCFLFLKYFLLNYLVFLA